jgi:hypothetical protein
MNAEIIAVVLSVVAIVLATLVAAVAKQIPNSFIGSFLGNLFGEREERNEIRVHNGVVSKGSKEAPTDGLSIRFTEVREVLGKQEIVSRAYRFASSVLTFGQFIVGGLLATSFLQESLSKSLVGGLGLLVLVSSLVRQYYRPEVHAFRAREKVARLKALVRKAEDQLFLIEENVSDALPRHKILMMLTDGLNQIEEAELRSAEQIDTDIQKTRKHLHEGSNTA